MSAVEHPPYDLESVYDEKIAPLMTQIIAICKEHKLPMVATFQYANLPDDAENPGPNWCTTMIHWEGARLQDKAKAAAAALRPERPISVATVSVDGKVTDVAVIL